MTEARIRHFYDEPTGTLSYVVDDQRSDRAAVIDCVLGYNLSSGRTDPRPSDVVIDYVREHGLTVDWILETHAHADHLSGAQYIKSKLGGEVAIGEGIRDVQAHFAPIFNCGKGFAADGRQFDRLFADGEVFRIGELDCEVIATPGHTNDSISYRIGSAVFVGDSLFMPDLAPRAAISRVAMPGFCMTRYGGCYHCPRTRDCSCATTTCPVDVSYVGSARSPSSAGTTSMRVMASVRTRSRACVANAMRP